MDGSIEIWKFIAGSLLLVLGWILGWKNASKVNEQGLSSKPSAWDIERQAVLLRIKQLEDLSAQRSEHPEFHPLSNYMNSQLGKFDNRLQFLEEKVKENGRE